MADNTVTMKAPKSDSTIIVTKDMVEYFLKMGYTKHDEVDIKKPVNNNMKKNKENK